MTYSDFINKLAKMFIEYNNDEDEEIRETKLMLKWYLNRQYGKSKQKHKLPKVSKQDLLEVFK